MAALQALSGRLMRAAARHMGSSCVSACELRHPHRAPARCVVRAATAAPTPGNPAVMRKFAALQQGVEDLGEEDDFVGSGASQNVEEDEAWQGAGFTEASSSDRRTSSAAATTSTAGINYLSVKKAEYVSSSTKLSTCPEPVLPEFAVIGRSNVGKSSLINMLTKSKKLALTSKQPGAPRHDSCCLCIAARSGAPSVAAQLSY